MIKTLVGLFRALKSKFVKSKLPPWLPESLALKCTHWSEPRSNLTVTVLGREVKLNTAPYCAACTTEYLNRYATNCGACPEPILPGEPVGVSFVGAPHPYTHLTTTCCASGALFCGHWGEGRLIPFKFTDDE